MVGRLEFAFGTARLMRDKNSIMTRIFASKLMRLEILESLTE